MRSFKGPRRKLKFCPFRKKMGKEVEKHEEKEQGQTNLTRTVCIPCEDTKFSKKLIQWAKANLIREGDKIVLVTVRSNFVKIGKAWPKTVIDFVSAYNQKEDDKSVERLKEYKEFLKDHEVEVKVLHGDVKTALVDFLEDLQPSACVLGRSGMHEARKMLVGHTCDYLVNNLKVPTLLYNFD